MRRIKRRQLVGRTRLTIAGAAALFGTLAAVALGATSFNVVAREFDPGKTFLVQAQWLSGIGCPTGAKTFDGTNTASYTDPACLTGDTRDRKVQGLLLAKTGPTENNAAAVADIKGVKGKSLTELGYDIRKPGASSTDPRGSWCGAGAPRFDIETTTDFYFLGCASPPPNAQIDGDGFIRLTWGGAVPLTAFALSTGLQSPVTGQVKSLSIVFDEGTTQFGAELGFGLAVLDNVNVNGVRVGQGSGNGNDEDDDGDD